MTPVPLQPVPNQTMQIILNNQNCQITVFQTPDALWMTLDVNDGNIIQGVICQNQNRIVRDLYLGFSGDFIFFDTQPDPNNGPSDPDYTGLGGRFQLLYLSPADLGGQG
jgi:hypothetical protein